MSTLCMVSIFTHLQSRSPYTVCNIGLAYKYNYYRSINIINVRLTAAVWGSRVFQNTYNRHKSCGWNPSLWKSSDLSTRGATRINHFYKTKSALWKYKNKPSRNGNVREKKKNQERLVGIFITWFTHRPTKFAWVSVNTPLWADANNGVHCNSGPKLPRTTGTWTHWAWHAPNSNEINSMSADV